MSRRSLGPRRFTPAFLFSLVVLAPNLALAQASPFLTGATALQTNILAWLTPIAIILVMVLGAMAMAPSTMTRMIAMGVSQARMFVCSAVAPVRKGDACASARFGAKTTSEKRNAGVNRLGPSDRRDIALPSPLWIGFEGAMPSRRMMRSDRLFAMK